MAHSASFVPIFKPSGSMPPVCTITPSGVISFGSFSVPFSGSSGPSGSSGTSGSSYVSGGYATTPSGKVIRMPGYYLPVPAPSSSTSAPVFVPSASAPVFVPPTSAPVFVAPAFHPMSLPVGSVTPPIGKVPPHLPVKIHVKHVSSIAPASMPVSHSVHHSASFAPSPASHPTHHGAGVIILENYKGKLALTLFKNTSSGKYDCPGGKIDDAKIAIENTASKELREETINMFNINPTNLIHSVDIPSGKKLYRAYVIHVQGPTDKNGKHPIFSAVYSTNMAVIGASKGVPHEWRETSDIARLYVDQFCSDYKSGHSGDLVTTDASGNSIVLNGRDKKLILTAISSGFISKKGTTTLPLLTMRHSKIGVSSKSFLIGTSSYEL